MPARDPGKPDGYYCDATRHKPGCPKKGCDGCAPPCSTRAGAGTSHVGIGKCARHLGATRNHVRAAEVVMAKQAVDRLGLRVIAPMAPEDAILDELHRTINNVAMLEAAVGELEQGEGGIYGQTYHASGEATGEAKPHVLVGMLWEERKNLRAVAAEAIKANVSQRHIELQEGHARILAAVVTKILVGLGHDPTSAEVQRIASAAFREIGHGDVVDGTARDVDAA